MPKPWLFRKTSGPRIWVRGVLGLLLLSLAATPALGHRLVVFAFYEGDTVRGEGKFMPNTPVKQGKVQVLDAKSGKELLTGLTDDQGKFSFNVPPEAAGQKPDLKIVIEAGLGHRGEFLLKAK